LVCPTGREDSKLNLNRFDCIVLQDDEESKCDVPDYPFAVYGVIGALGVDKTPLICGGSGHNGVGQFTQKLLVEILNKDYKETIMDWPIQNLSTI
jgi:hypothetical protein